MKQNVDVQRIHEEMKIKIEPEDQKLPSEHFKANEYSSVIEPTNRRRKSSQMNDDSNSLDGVSRIASIKRRRYSESDDESENQIW